MTFLCATQLQTNTSDGLRVDPNGSHTRTRYPSRIGIRRTDDKARDILGRRQELPNVCDAKAEMLASHPIRKIDLVGCSIWSARCLAVKYHDLTFVIVG